MKRIAIFSGILVGLLTMFAGYELFERGTGKMRAKRMITGLLCDASLQQKINKEYRNKRSIEKSAGTSSKQTIWVWAVNRVSRQMIKERVNTSTLKKMLGSHGELFGSLSTEISALAKSRCGFVIRSQIDRFKVAMVWEMVAAYASMPSPIRCLKCLLPENKRVAMLGGMERTLPSFGWNRIRQIRLTPQQKHSITRSSLHFASKHKWLFRKLAKPTENGKLPYMKAVLYYTDILDKKPNDLYALTERGQAYLAIGQFKDGVRELQMAIALCQKRLALDPTEHQTYYLRALSQAALTEFAEAAKSMKVAILWAGRLGKRGKLPYYREFLKGYKGNYKALQEFKKR